MIEKKSKYIFPESGTIYDFSFEFEPNNFQSWTEKFKDFSIGFFINIILNVLLIINFDFNKKK